MCIEIDCFDLVALMGASLGKIGKVFESVVTLLAHFERLVTSAAELLNGTLKANSQRVGWYIQNLTHRARDASAVRVDIVDGIELVRDLAAETMRQRVRDLVKDVEGHCDSFHGLVVY
jgi:hypothetical protein